MDESKRKIEIGKRKIEELYGKQDTWPPDNELLDIIRFNKWHIFNEPTRHSDSPPELPGLPNRDRLPKEEHPRGSDK